MDLGPTQGCREAITCLETHCSLVKGSTSKEVLEVFYQEVGIRLHAYAFLSSLDLIQAHLMTLMAGNLKQDCAKASEEADHITRGRIPGHRGFECVPYIYRYPEGSTDIFRLCQPQDAGACLYCGGCEGSGPDCEGCDALWWLFPPRGKLLTIA